MVSLHNADCFDFLPTLDSESVDLILIDPPYNIKLTTEKIRVRNTDLRIDIRHAWDNFETEEAYNEFCLRFLKEGLRVLKEQGLFYVWHQNMRSIAKIIELAESVGLKFLQYIIVDKSDYFQNRSWQNRTENATNRMWFNTAELCVIFKKDIEAVFPEEITKWYNMQLFHKGLDRREVRKRFCEYSGLSKSLFDMYFVKCLPTKEVFEEFFVKQLGFEYMYGYEDLRKRVADSKYYFQCKGDMNNVWKGYYLYGPGQGVVRHPCEKWERLLEKIIEASCRPSGVVLDFFMGGGATAEACMRLNRDFIGCEKDKKYFEMAEKRVQLTNIELESHITNFL